MKYTNQAPKEFDKMSAAFKKKYGNFENLPADRWYVQPKYDGVFAMVFTGAPHFPGRALTRTGDVMKSIDHIVDKAREVFGWGKVVFGEVWCHDKTHQEINGASRRHTPQPDLRMVVFDMVAECDYNLGEDPTDYSTRLSTLNHYLERERFELGQYSTFIKAHTMHQDWVNIHLGYHMLQDFANELVTGHVEGFYGPFDGAMLVDMKAPWVAGAVKEGAAIKVKHKLTLDLKVIAQFAEQKPTKLGGYLTVEYKGVRSDVGSGLTQAMLTNILAVQNGAPLCGYGDYATQPFYIGRVAEVECLGLTPDGKLREPRLKGFRHDTVREEDK